MNIDGHNGFVVHTVYPGETSWPDRFLHLADVVPVDYTAPGRPEPVTAATADQGVRVAWKAPADDVGVTGYRVLRNGMPLAETQAPSYVDRQASPGQAYTYSVVAYDEAGNVSEPATTVLGQDVPALPRQQGPFLPGSASVIAAGDSTAVCGRLGSERNPRVGCRLRTLGGWATVRTGRSVPWGLADTRTFVSGDDGRVWFCRVLAGRPGANACLPLDVATRSWGFDRVDRRHPQPTDATWVTTAAEPTRCGTAGDRATCSVLLERGWRTRTAAGGTRPGDPLSRASRARGAPSRSPGLRRCPDELQQGRHHVDGVDVLVARAAVGADAGGPVHDERVRHATLVGVALEPLERGVAGPRPSPGVVVVRPRACRGRRCGGGSPRSSRGRS